MKKRSGHILLTFISLVLLCVSCGKNGADVIPRSKLAHIYAEMLITDQWILSTPNVRTIADTTLVYEPILEKYGYDSEDYLKSVDVYMDDPERYAKIFREASELLDKRLGELRAKKREIEKAEARRKEMEKYRTDFKPEEFFPYMSDEPYVHYYDSVAFVPDSLKNIYRINPIERADTIYDRLEMIILKADTLAVSDTLIVTDTLAVSDTLARTDSVSLMDKPSAAKIKKHLLDPINGKE